MQPHESALVITRTAVYTEVESERQAIVTTDFYRGDDGSLWAIETADGVPRPPRYVTPTYARVLREHFAPGGGPDPDHRAPRPIPDPVNLDGSPRNRLRDRLAVEPLLESQAAD